MINPTTPKLVIFTAYDKSYDTKTGDFTAYDKSYDIKTRVFIELEKSYDTKTRVFIGSGVPMAIKTGFL
jgi:hypothetical protein